MAPANPSNAATLRRSGRNANRAARGVATLPAADNNRITKHSLPKPPKRDCSTCGRTLAASAFFKRPSTGNCKHDINTCKSCLKSWITMQLKMTTHDKLSCPECSEIMSNIDVKKLATKDTYAKYDELERRAFEEKTPGWRWCLAPQCRAGQVHQPLLEEVSASADTAGKKKKGGRKKKAKGNEVCVCETCGAKACVSCDCPYHDGETCAQYQKRVKRQAGEEETKSLAHIQSACKKCPKCEKNIEKNGGCDQVACTQCGESFCWLCTTSYHVINKQGHAAGCTYAKAGRFDPHAARNAPNNLLPGNLFHNFIANAFR